MQYWAKQSDTTSCDPYKYVIFMLFRLTSHLRERERERERDLLQLIKKLLSLHMDLVSSRGTLENFNKAFFVSLSLWFLVWFIASCLEENETLVLPTIASKLYLHTEAVYIQYNVYGQLFEVSRKYVPLVEALVVSSGKLSSSHQSLLLFECSLVLYSWVSVLRWTQCRARIFEGSRRS